MQREIGKTGIKVHPIGLGGMPLSIQGRPDEDKGLAVLKASIDAGVDFIDTANVYCLNDKDIGHNEALISKALERFGKREAVTVATKGGLRRPNGDWTTDARPQFLRDSCLKSLEALGRDCITLYQLHAPDDKVPLEDSVGELARLQKEGKILHIGLSNVDRAELEQALNIVRVESVQNRCNPFHREDYQSGLVKFCEEKEISYLPYSPVGGGRGHARVSDSSELGEIAKKRGVSPYQVVLAWHLSKGKRVLPIPGASRLESATDSPRAAALSLAPEELRRIDALSN